MWQTRSSFLACLCWLLMAETKECDATVYATLGSQSILPCPLSSVINNTQWLGPPGNIPYNLPGTTILNYDELPADFLKRLAIHQTTGALIINNTQRSDENVYICKVLTNATSVKLSILDAPLKILVGLDANFSFQLNSSIPVDDILIIDKEGESMIMAVFNGIANYELAYRNRVLFTGNVQQKQISFVLKNVTLRDAGKYVAKTVVSSLGEQILIVKASPTKPLVMELNIAESGSSYHLNCTTNSNSAPFGHGLVMFAEWKVNGIVITPGGRYIVQGTELTISNLSNGQDNGAQITCFAYEDQLAKSNESDALTIDIKYGPGSSINLGSIPSILSVNHLKKAPNITCNAICNPPCDYRWYKDGTFYSSGATLSIGMVEKSTGGKYVCQAYNNLNLNRSSSTAVNIIVFYGAEIVNLSAQGSNTVNENSSASFHCHVDSNPLPNITWIREDNNTVLMTESGVLQSQFRIISANCLDMGNYSCTAYNGIGTAVTEILQLFVNCHPRTDFQFPQETKIYGKRHSAAILRYRVISYPLPTFTWTFIGNGSETRGLPVSASQHDDGHLSELMFTSLGIDDFGNYYVIANNSMGPSAKEVFEIIPADIPEVPSNVIVMDLTPNSVTIQWLAGNSGGPEQTFHIVASAGEFTRSVSVPDPGYGKKGTAVLESLLPRTRYSIFITAINAVGQSNTTDAIVIVTPEVASTSENPGLPVTGIAGGISAGIVIVFAVIIGIFLWRRYHTKQSEHDNVKKKGLEERSQIKANSVKQEVASGKVYEGLHFREIEASQYLELNDIALEENRNANIRPPENDSYEKLHPYTNNDIQMYSSLEIPKTSKDSDEKYENTWMKRNDTANEYH